MTAIRASRPSASVFVQESGDIGAHDRAKAEMVEGGLDGALEMALLPP